MNLEMLQMWNEQIAQKMKILKKMAWKLHECFSGGDDLLKVITHQEWHDRIYSDFPKLRAAMFIFEIQSWQDFQQNFLLSLWPSEELSISSSSSWNNKHKKIDDWNSSAGKFLREGFKEACLNLIRYISWCEIKADASDSNDASFVFDLKDSINNPERYYKLNCCLNNLEKHLLEIYPTIDLECECQREFYYYVMRGGREEILSIYWD